MDVIIERKLWESWLDSRQLAIRNQLFELYKGWVEYEAKNLYFKTAFASVELDDYFHYGHIGLLEAIEGYKDLCIKFTSYAVYRVRGAILNKVFKFSEAAAIYQKRQAISDEYINSYIKQIALENESSFESTVIEMTLEYFLAADVGEQDIKQALPMTNYDSSEHDILLGSVKTKTKQLSETEQTILTLYYHLGFNFQQIAEALDLSKGRVSQIHTKAISSLKLKLNW
ncbi:sigma-70 family RNA polymerase sigma factor [Colwellia sp. MEBiC06753]